MPLVKDLKVDRDLCVDTFRRREFMIAKDFVRRQEMGKEVSVRTSTMKGEGLIRVLRSISEEEVKIDNLAIELYENAEDWLCQRLTNNVFQSVLHLGFQPTKLPFERQFFVEGEKYFTENCNDLVWFPACALYVGDERIYIFRVASTKTSNGWSPTSDINGRYSGAIGFTKEYLSAFSSELAAYVNRLEKSAMEDENVKRAFETLGAHLRPQAYRDEKLRERMAEYKDTSFGGWS